MKGDKLVIQEEHVRAAGGVMKILFPEIEKVEDKFVVTIAGESGSGKSEIASVLSVLLSEKKVQSIIFQQDDYFVYPPKTNAEKRKKDIGHVGLSEVKLDVLDRDLQDFLNGKLEIVKPLVVFEEDLITEKKVKLEGFRVAIVEGTYTTLLNSANKHVFIDRTFRETKQARKRRAREEQDEFLEKILEIEHEIISSHREKAEIIITKGYEVLKESWEK